MKPGYVYIMGNDRPTLYTGVTNNLSRRVYEHKNKLLKGFTSKYNLTKLLYYEFHFDIVSAIVREKQIKDMNRDEKLRMIEEFNKEYKDLYEFIIR